MASAYKCDRCGMLYERLCIPKIQIIEYRDRVLYNRKDLCPECQITLENWFKDYERKEIHKK
jgi:hypothetical protein